VDEISISFAGNVSSNIVLRFSVDCHQRIDSDGIVEADDSARQDPYQR